MKTWEIYISIIIFWTVLMAINFELYGIRQLLISILEKL